MINAILLSKILANNIDQSWKKQVIIWILEDNIKFLLEVIQNA